MASRTFKKNKKTKHGRTRRQRQRRRQMRGGIGFFDGISMDFLKPTVYNAEYCQKQTDKCTANIKPDSVSSAADSVSSATDSSSSNFFETPTILKNIFGTPDSTVSVDDGYPVAASPALVANGSSLAPAEYGSSLAPAAYGSFLAPAEYGSFPAPAACGSSLAPLVVSGYAPVLLAVYEHALPVLFLSSLAPLAAALAAFPAPAV